MITAGIDIGSKRIKAAVLCDGALVGKAIAVAGLDVAVTAGEVLEAAMHDAGVTRAEIGALVATGAGREQAPDKDRTITEVGAAARGAVSLFPEARAVVDVGAEEGRAIRCDESGRVIDFAVNERCAAGAGAFTEAMARALELPVEELGPLSLKSARAMPMNAQCVVFVESEVVALIHDNASKPDIARAVHDAIASRVVSMVRKLGYRTPLVLVGGLARNVGFVDSFIRGLQTDAVQIPEQPEYCGAYGAALAAADNA